MFFVPFWIFVAVSLILAIIACFIHKFKFIDIQLIIMVIAVSMSLDMLLCKQLWLYHYVNVIDRGWYSFWANSVIVPSVAIIFIKFVPVRRVKAALYIIVWSIFCTLLEEFVIKHFKIIDYLKWKPFPFSTIGYLITFTWTILYYRILKRRIREA